ncbi:MAG: hypothetical protein FJY65_03620 [Calditrichaeota bacterium]|nr:hypothetical protein [Calditrichota bacterium]
MRSRRRKRLCRQCLTAAVWAEWITDGDGDGDGDGDSDGDSDGDDDGDGEGQKLRQVFSPDATVFWRRSN